jgi:hypothetical protein
MDVPTQKEDRCSPVERTDHRLIFSASIRYACIIRSLVEVFCGLDQSFCISPYWCAHAKLFPRALSAQNRLVCHHLGLYATTWACMPPFFFGLYATLGLCATNSSACMPPWAYLPPLGLICHPSRVLSAHIWLVRHFSAYPPPFLALSALNFALLIVIDAALALQTLLVHFFSPSLTVIGVALVPRTLSVHSFALIDHD